MYRKENNDKRNGWCDVGMFVQQRPQVTEPGTEMETTGRQKGTEDVKPGRKV
jgi:hypothetical protein